LLFRHHQTLRVLQPAQQKVLLQVPSSELLDRQQ
jgi:hypothetical protein